MKTESPGLDVLNIADGHMKFRFDKNNPTDLGKAKVVLTDMLKRGYMLFVMVDGEQQRVRSFDADKEEYILEEPDVIPEPKDIPEPQASPPPAKARRGRRGVPMRSTRATGIGPTAGG